MSSSVILWIAIIAAICIALFLLLVLFYPNILHPNLITNFTDTNNLDVINNYYETHNDNDDNIIDHHNVKLFSRNRPSDFPSNTGREGQEVLGEFNTKYPNYQIEIVQTSDTNAIRELDQTTIKTDRIRMFVNETGKVTGMYIG